MDSSDTLFLFSDDADGHKVNDLIIDNNQKITGPLAHRMRPSSLEDFVGQDHIRHKQSLVSSIIAGNSDISLILYGPPGTGKTTLAYIIAQATNRHCESLSALDLSVKELRGYIESARIRRTRGVRTILFIDEIHRFSKSQQDALLSAVEHGIILLIAATTENPSFSVISPLLSRSLIVPLYALTDTDLDKVIVQAISSKNGFDNAVTITSEAKETICHLSTGDARRALTILESAAGAASSRIEDSVGSALSMQSLPVEIIIEDVLNAISTAIVRYDKDGDQHYDTISAFIKSVRGSDVDAALHYLARMIAAGEDPRFIARRLIILASEDIGMADPQSLLIAHAAAQAVQLIGMPEGRITLAHATIHLASAPKSNAVITAIDAALADIAAGKGAAVPPHLRDTSYLGAKQLDNGIKYKYPHDFINGIIDQQYPPDDLVGKQYYHPTDHGYEQHLVQRIEKLRSAIWAQHPDKKI